MLANLLPHYERNQEATIYVGNLDERVKEEMIWELFIQCGPVVNVHMPHDKVLKGHQGYGFVEFRSEEDADYAIKIMHMIKLFGRPMKVNKASHDKRTQEVGATIFVGSLDPDVDEKMLYDSFSSFGLILSTKIMRDTESGASKGFGFVSYDNFESSDQAIQSMEGQYLCNKMIHVSYAYKNDSTHELHGTAAERLLAANKPISRFGPTGPILPGPTPETTNSASFPLVLPKSLFENQKASGLENVSSLPALPNFGSNSQMPFLPKIPNIDIPLPSLPSMKSK